MDVLGVQPPQGEKDLVEASGETLKRLKGAYKRGHYFQRVWLALDPPGWREEDTHPDACVLLEGRSASAGGTPPPHCLPPLRSNLASRPSPLLEGSGGFVDEDI